MGLNDSNKHQYLQDINCSYILHAYLSNLNSTSTTLIALILYFLFFKKMRDNVFNTLHYPNASSNGWHYGTNFFLPEKNLEFFRLKICAIDANPGKLE